ncbi:MAG: DUF4476 domain-containing protein [Bacteroidota bacterium]
MKRSLLVAVLFVIITNITFAQKSNLTFFTEQKELFFVFINGVKQNNNASFNIKVADLSTPSCKCKIVFNNPRIRKIDKIIKLKPGFETTYTILRNNKNKWEVRWFSETAIPAVIINQNSNNQHPLDHHPNNNPNSVNNNTNQHTNTNSNQDYTHQNEYEKHNDHHNDKWDNHNKPIYEPVPGYKGAIGCNNPLDQQNFQNVKQTIASKKFEDSKLTIAKQVINNNCLLASQVKDILFLFEFENTRLDFAKYAYGLTYDIGNYYLLNDAFKFEASVNDLNKYISDYNRNNRNEPYYEKDDKNYNQNDYKKHHHEKENHEKVVVYEPVPGYTGKIGCNNPMTHESFQNVKQSIASKSFEDTKLTIAKQVLNNNCLLTSQVKEILLLFSFENTKLDFAKYAYSYTYDIGNYYMLNDAFQFESSINDLNKFIIKK